MASHRTLLCVIAIGAAGCSVAFDEKLLVDGAPRLDREGVDLAGDHRAADQGPASDAKVSDTNATDAKGPDLPPVDCTAWSNWSCSLKVKNSVSRCPKAGVQVYGLGCNTTGCSCTNKLTLASKTCSVSSGITCADAQAAFASGCCSGI